jgi:anti-sigma-K factor RskA
MKAMDHNELRELTGAYALGILSDDERQALEGHLRDCQTCAAEVRQTIAAASTLAIGVKQIDPPSSLRSRVLNEVAGADRGSVETRVRRGYSVLPYWLSAAAALAAIALGLYAVSLRNRITALEAQLRVATAATATMQKQLISLSADADDWRRRATILTAPDVRRVDLAGVAPAAGASARAYWSPAEGLFMSGTNLPALPQGRVYQLWMVTPEQKALGVALLTPDASGHVTTMISTPPGVTRIAALAVTLEPAGGSPAPTGDKVLIGLL